jgi:hypothetical protein
MKKAGTAHTRHAVLEETASHGAGGTMAKKSLIAKAQRL